MSDKIKEALKLIDHYSDEYWWFDNDLIIHEAMNDLLSERGRLREQYSQCQQFIGTQKVLTNELCARLNALDAPPELNPDA